MVYLAVLYGFAAPLVRRVLPRKADQRRQRSRLFSQLVTSYWVVVAGLYLVQTGRALMEWLPA